mmetsp:Transcript_13258/g.24879  ORF Transcript_13258/g.24879 Transcript_13258/m.24879 type:complete len:536 (+) Transcript_13258:52-1659(+)
MLIQSLKKSTCLIGTLLVLFGFCSFLPVYSFHLSHRRSSWSSSQFYSQRTPSSFQQSYDVCILGGGISGLAAAITAASKHKQQSIVLLEAQSRPGGRVVSEYRNGYTLDIGYAVFVEKYPQSKNIFDYNSLQLKQYEPGALIKINNTNKRTDTGFARIADPLRQPSKMMDTILSPVGKVMDKIRLLPLFYYVKTKSIEEIFQDDESDTLSCLRNKYKFSQEMIQEFFEPFLKGIYFSPLDEQSSRMFHFVFKMFVEGAASLPTGGMQAISNQLMEKAMSMGVEIRLNHSVKNVSYDGANDVRNSGRVICDGGGGGYSVVMDKGGCIHAKSVICATDDMTAKRILTSVLGLDSLSLLELERQPQRSIGCMYYTFDGDTPVKDAVLILNGEGKESGPCLTVSFLHVVNESYAPANCGICSVSIPSEYMEQYIGPRRTEELDKVVRDQLASWWPDYDHDIRFKWKLEQLYDIQNAQPAQYFGPQPATVHGGRDPNKLQGVQLADGLFVCGDYMATATLNGAIESGVNAAEGALEFLNR